MVDEVSGGGSDLVPAGAGPALPVLRPPVVEAARGYAAASRAASTRRKSDAAWDDFSARCVAADQEAHPAHPAVVAASLSAEAARGLSPSAIQVKLSAIG